MEMRNSTRALFREADFRNDYDGRKSSRFRTIRQEKWQIRQPNWHRLLHFPPRVAQTVARERQFAIDPAISLWISARRCIFRAAFRLKGALDQHRVAVAKKPIAV